MSRSTATDHSVAAPRSEAQSSARERGASQPDDPSASGNLDKIRDILFGAQAREHDRRFAQLEQHLLREATDLRHDLKRRFESLEGYIKNEVEALTNRLTKEQELRGESTAKLAEGLAQLATTLNHKACELESQSAQSQSHLMQQLTDRTAALANDIRAHHKEATSALNQAVHDLRNEKTDRSALAAILIAAGQRLANDEANAARS